nr:hypothetical protein GCM10025699_13920 [Microbacterium flavescens]
MTTAVRLRLRVGGSPHRAGTHTLRHGIARSVEQLIEQRIGGRAGFAEHPREIRSEPIGRLRQDAADGTRLPFRLHEADDAAIALPPEPVLPTEVVDDQRRTHSGRLSDRPNRRGAEALR